MGDYDGQPSSKLKRELAFDGLAGEEQVLILAYRRMMDPNSQDIDKITILQDGTINIE